MKYYKIYKLCSIFEELSSTGNNFNIKTAQDSSYRYWPTDFRLLLNKFEKLASARLIDAITKKVNMPIIVETQGDFSLIVPLKIEGGTMYPMGSVYLESPNIQMNKGYNPSEFKRISAINAPDSWIAMYLFGAALYVGRKIVSDSTVTPAAQAVMKRMYQKYKDDPSIIIPNVLAEQPSTATNIEGGKYESGREHGDEDKPWMRAAYLNPGNGDAQYQAAIEAGQKIKNALSDDHFDQLIDIVENTWNRKFEEEAEEKKQPDQLEEPEQSDQLEEPEQSEQPGQSGFSRFFPSFF